MPNDNLGDRMKTYETASSVYLTRRTPVIIRLDMVAGHTFCKGFDKPYDEAFMSAMNTTAQALCRSIQGCKLAYIQSDEISLVLTDWETVRTDAWYGYRIQKVASVSAAIATREFNLAYKIYCEQWIRMTLEDIFKANAEGHIAKDKNYKSKIGTAIFDSRCFNLPKEEVCNYFIWRQNDATRNSILGYGQSMFTHKQMQGKKCPEIQEMMFGAYGFNWNNLPSGKKRGTCITKSNTIWILDNDIPIFTQDREYIEKTMRTGEEIYASIHSD